MNPWLNYSHLYYFKTIAEEGSIAKASEKLSLGAPALSMQLKLLEENLQIKLFERKNKKLILTESGKIVLDYAISIFRLGLEMVDHLGDKKNPDKLRLQVGVHFALPKSIIGKLTNFVFAQGDSYITIEAGNTEMLMNNLLYHNFDLVVLPAAPLIKDKSLIISKSILKSKIVFCGAKKFRNSKKTFPQLLDAAPIILPSGDNKLRHDVENFFRENKLTLNIVAECEDTYIQKQMAIHGDGVVPMMYDAVKPYLKAHALNILGELPDIYEEIWIACMKRKIQNPLNQNIFDKFKI